jgi:hypothetical protein
MPYFTSLEGVLRYPYNHEVSNSSNIRKQKALHHRPEHPSKNSATLQVQNHSSERLTIEAGEAVHVLGRVLEHPVVAVAVLQAVHRERLEAAPPQGDHQRVACFQNFSMPPVLLHTDLHKRGEREFQWHGLSCRLEYVSGSASRTIEGSLV